MSVQLYQIYWRDDQLPNLFPFAIPYKNEGLTPFFENSVIAELVPRETAYKIGVASWQLRQKIGGGIPMKQHFTEDVMNWDYEVLSLGRKQEPKTMLFRLNEWHKGSVEVLAKIFQKLGINSLQEPKDPIYQNHFIARTDIYQDYVKELLIPAMNLMVNDEEISRLVNVDSGYYKILPPYTEYAHRVNKFLGTNHVPLHAFLCERMFSIWLHGKPIKVRYV